MYATHDASAGMLPSGLLSSAVTAGMPFSSDTTKPHRP